MIYSVPLLYPHTLNLSMFTTVRSDISHLFLLMSVWPIFLFSGVFTGRHDNRSTIPRLAHFLTLLTRPTHLPKQNSCSLSAAEYSAGQKTATFMNRIVDMH